MEQKEGVLHAFREELGQLYYYRGSDKNWTMMNYHYHETCEITLAMSEGVIINIGNRSYKAKAGDLFLFHSKVPHRIQPIENSNYKRYVLMFDLEVARKLGEVLGYQLEQCFEQGMDQSIPKISLSDSALTKMIEMLDRIDPLYTMQREPQSRAMIYLIIAEILIYIHQLQSFFLSEESKEQYSSVRFETHDNEKVRIQQIKQFICDNIEKKPSLNMIAEQFFISKYYLSHYFRRETGFSIMQYIAMQKIIRAKKMLRSGCSITNVAMTLGYNSDSHFISTFQKYAGITPKRYVLEHNHDKNQ